MFKHLIRSIRRPLLRFLSQGDLIIIGDVHARLDRPLIALGVGYVDVLGNITCSDTNFGCIVPPGYREPPSTAYVLPQVIPSASSKYWIMDPPVSAGSVAPGPNWYMVYSGGVFHTTLNPGDIVQMVEDPIMRNWLYRRDGTLHGLVDKAGQYIILRGLSAPSRPTSPIVSWKEPYS